MKIAVITSSLPPHPVGGAERQALETAKRLAARGHDVVVFARRLPPDAPRRVRSDGVTWIRTGTVNLPALRFAAHAANFLRDWRAEGGDGFDVVLAFQLIINGFLGSLVAGRDTPLVSWVRCESEARWLERPLTRPVVVRALDRTRKLLFQAPVIRDDLLGRLEARRGPAFAAALRARSAILSNAVELGPEPVPENRRGLLFVGRLMPQKGVDVLLAALRLLPEPPPLRVLGTGPLGAELETLAADLPVEFLGHRPPEAVREELDRARVFVFPSRWEGFPNAVLEAFERGVPVVATRVGAVEALVDDGANGLLVPPEDPRALAEAIGRLLHDDALRERLSGGARDTARTHGWPDHLDRLEAVLDEVAGSGSPPSADAPAGDRAPAT